MGNFPDNLGFIAGWLEKQSPDNQEKYLAWLLKGTDAERRAVFALNSAALAGALAAIQTNPLLGKFPIASAAAFLIGMLWAGLSWREQHQAGDPLSDAVRRLQHALLGGFFQSMALMFFSIGLIVLVGTFAAVYL